MWHSQRVATKMPWFGIRWDRRNGGLFLIPAERRRRDATCGGRHADAAWPHRRRNGVVPAGSVHSDPLAASRRMLLAITRRWIWLVPS